MNVVSADPDAIEQHSTAAVVKEVTAKMTEMLVTNIQLKYQQIEQLQRFWDWDYEQQAIFQANQHPC